MRQAWRRIVCWWLGHEWDWGNGIVVPLRARCERCGKRMNLAG